MIVTRKHDAKDPTLAASRCLTAVQNGTTTTVGGKTITVRADSICVHSDTPNAVDIASAVRDAVKPFLSAH